MNSYFAEVNVKTICPVNKVVVTYAEVNPFTRETTHYIKMVDKEGLKNLIDYDNLGKLILGGLWYKTFHTCNFSAMQAFLKDWDKEVRVD